MPQRKNRTKPRYDCAKCPGYCCSYPLIALNKRDVERLAKHFRLSFKKAKATEANAQCLTCHTLDLVNLLSCSMRVFLEQAPSKLALQ